MKRHILTLVFLFLLLGNSVKSQATLEFYLGFKIMPTAGTKVITFAIVGVDPTDNNKIDKIEFISEDNFALYSKGLLWCKANPTKTNFFETYEIDCGIMLDDPKMKKGIMVQDTMWDEMKPLCLPIFDIWKLKYGVHPHYSSSSTTIPDEDKGWATTRYYPSYKQVQKLQEYGVKNVDDYFYGPKMYQLLKDMQDEAWVENYKSLLD